MDDCLATAPALPLLLERFRAGDSFAREELFHLAYEPLSRCTRRMLRDFPSVRRWDEADDVLHSALLRLLRSLRIAEPADWREFFALATQEVRRELYDLARLYSGPQWQYTHQPGPARQGKAKPLEDVPDRTEEPGDLEAWSAFQREVANLPSGEREVFSLLFYRGWTQAHVAKWCHVTARTVQRRPESALRKLHQRLS
jgi:RNA polymerase sigma-70 factor (ECF subfamily)